MICPDLGFERTATGQIRVDIGKAGRQSGARRQRSPGESVIVDAGTWLWRPEPYDDNDQWS